MTNVGSRSGSTSRFAPPGSSRQRVSRGLPISSGPVESAADHVDHARRHLSDLHYRLDRASATAPAIALAASCFLSLVGSRFARTTVDSPVSGLKTARLWKPRIEPS